MRKSPRKLRKPAFSVTQEVPSAALPHDPVSRRLSMVVLSLAAAVIITGVLSLIGWIADVPRLTDWLGLGISVMPNTAVALVIAGAGLVLLALDRRIAGGACGVLVGLVGAATLFQHLSGISLGIDGIIPLREWGRGGTVVPGRMGPPASSCFTLLGAAMVCAAAGRRRVAAAASLLVGALALLSLLGYLYQVSPLYSAPRLTAIAVPTSLMLMALGIGLTLTALRTQACEALRGRAPSAVFARRMIPWVVLVPITIGWLRTLGERYILFDSAFGTAVRTLLELVLFSLLTWWIFVALRDHDRERRISQTALERQRAQLAAFLDTAAVGLHRVGPDGTILWANEAELRLLGYAPGEYLGRNIAEFHADPAVIADILARLHRGERIRDVEARMRCRDGSLRTVLIDSSVLWENGTFVHTQCFTRDVTAQRHAEQQLRESERRFHEMIDSLPAAVYTTDAQGRLTYFNPAAAAFSGREPALGSDEWCVSWKLYYPDGTPMPHDRCPMAIALREGRVIRGAEAIAERPDGSRVSFQPYPTPLRDAAGNITGGINMLVDISERKHAERSLARLAAIVEASDDAIVSQTLGGTITSWNPGAQKIFGYTENEAVGRHIRLLVPPDRHAEADELLARVRNGETISHFETVRRTKDGRLIDVSLSVSPLRDSSGAIIGASKVSRDITERKRAAAALAAHAEELERRVEERTRDLVAAHERLRLADRMAAVGTLASGLAHDMKNVLLPLGMRLDGLLSTPGLPREATDDLAAVCGLLDHLRAMASNLSLFAKDPSQDGAEGRTQLAKWCGQVRGFIDASAGSSVYIKWEIPEGLPHVAIAPHRLTQAVLNLVHNGRDAILAKGGPLAGTTCGGRIMVQARPVGERVVLSVSDDGCGMTEAIRRRCLEPFFTTKDRPAIAGAGGGTGLGLSLAHAIIVRVGGTLEIDSAPDRGTTVVMQLPVAPEASPQPAQAGPIAARVRIGDARKRAIVRHILDGLKYRVIDDAAPNAASADPDERLWIIDGGTTTIAESRAFLAGGPGRGVICLQRTPAEAEDGQIWRAAGVLLLRPDATISEIRTALSNSAAGPSSRTTAIELKPRPAAATRNR